MITQVLTGLAIGELRAYVARLKRLAILYAMLALFALGMVFFLVLALYLWVASEYGPLWAALGFAGGWLVLILITYIFVLVTRRRARRENAGRLQRDLNSLAGVAALSTASRAAGAARNRKGLILVPAAAAGAFAAYRLLRNRRQS
ncbi:phage holin family protein [Consotaella aegiceratis]|uniref:phage holin family protein n=1 Tax=Consotaella aegiceratis TaxID=3097961 RepID=UPI002F423CE1